MPEILELLLIGEERLNIFVEGHKPRCFGCGKLGHIRLECRRGETGEDKQEGGEEREGKINRKAESRERKKKRLWKRKNERQGAKKERLRLCPKKIKENRLRLKRKKIQWSW